MIVSSSFVAGGAQIDGRVWVVETHTLADGAELSFTYLIEPDRDFAAIAAERAAALNEQFASGE